MSSTIDEIRGVLSDWEKAKQRREDALKAIDEVYESEIKALEQRERSARASMVAAQAAETARRNTEIRRAEREFGERIRDAERSDRELLKSINAQKDELKSLEAKLSHESGKVESFEIIDHQELFDADDYNELLKVALDTSLLSSAKRLFGGGALSPAQATGRILAMIEHDKVILESREKAVREGSKVGELRSQLKLKIEEIEAKASGIPSQEIAADDFAGTRENVRSNYEAERTRVESSSGVEALGSIIGRCRDVAIRRSEELGSTPKQLSENYAYPDKDPVEMFDYWALIEIGDQKVPVPHSYETRSPINYLFTTGGNSDLAIRSIRSMVAFKMKQKPFGALKVIWLDVVTMGMSLGVLAELASPVSSDKETPIKVASNQREMSLAFDEIDGEMGDRSLRVASAGNVWDYNEGSNNPISELLVVGIGLDGEQYEKRYIETLTKAVLNVDLLGVQVMSSVDEGFLAKGMESSIGGLASKCKIIDARGELPVSCSDGERHALLFAGENWVKAHLVEPMLIQPKRTMQTRQPLPMAINIDENGLRIPLGWQKSGEVAYLDYAEYAHAFLAGRTGSGKSVFLHNVISKACERFSPSELEICLVDYKKSEFGIYRDEKYCFSNIIFIGLDNTRSFVDALMRYLMSIFKERQDLVNKDNSRNIANYNKTHEAKMPRLLIIMDEFHRQSSLTDYAGESARNLEFLLRESRAYGMHFLIADQEIGNLAGLSDSAKKQLGGRIQLDWTETSELVNMFELAGYDLGISQLEIGQAIFKTSGELKLCSWPFVSEEDIADIRASAAAKWSRKAELRVQDSSEPIKMAISELPGMPGGAIPIGTTANFLNPLVGITLAKRRRENLFILNKDEKKTIDLVCAMAIGFASSRSNGRVVLMSLEDDLFYLNNLRYWESIAGRCDFKELLSLPDICAYCESGVNEGDFLIIVGLDVIAESLEECGEKRVRSKGPHESSSIESIDARLEILLQMESGESADAATDDGDENACDVYDARSDLFEIVKSGGTRDTHVCSVSDTVFSFYSVFGASSVQDDFKDLFPYRLAPACEYGEAASLGMVEAASTENTAGESIYMVTRAGSKEEFRPLDIQV